MKALLNKLQQIYQNKTAKILDIGGWYAPCKQATHMLDIMPFETLNRAAAYGFGEMKINKENYLAADLGEMDRLPYGNKEFDFVVCRHTLEDIKDPIKVCREMMRVAKAGYLETPHRIYEITKGVERPWWCGHYHHRWLVEMDRDLNRVSFQFKPHNLHSSRRFYLRRYPWQKVRDEFMNAWLLWEDHFEVGEKVIIDGSEMKKDLEMFKKSLKGKRIFRYRWAQD